MPGGNKKVAHTKTNLQLKAAGLFKYVWPFCYRQAKGLKHCYLLQFLLLFYVHSVPKIWMYM